MRKMSLLTGLLAFSYTLVLGAAEPQINKAQTKEATAEVQAEEDEFAGFDEQTRAILLKLKQEKVRLELENALQEQKNKQLVAEINAENERLKAQAEIAEQQNKLELAKLELEKSQRALENDLREEALRKERLERQLKVASPQYLDEPLQGNTLVITDRRIPLNGVIVPGMAEEITRQIHYFNNLDSHYPIFIVIDVSPGGSVIEGARIIEAMRNSQAPVYVVVKSIAASMAAILTAAAERSFAYPNAMFIHHQIASLYFGNRTQITEHMDLADKWAQRVEVVVAQKMGVSLDDFVQQMYEHSKSGNWVEFADAAQQLGWVDHVIAGVRETSFVDELESIPPAPESNEKTLAIENKQTALANLAGQAVMPEAETGARIPHLMPGDIYHLYNPDGYYRY